MIDILRPAAVLRPAGSPALAARARPRPAVSSCLRAAVGAALLAVTVGLGSAAAAEPALLAAPVPPGRNLTPAEAELWAEQGIDAPSTRLLSQAEDRKAGRVTTLRVAVILVDFPDVPADRAAHPPEYYQRLLFSHGELPGGSVAEFLETSSHGRFLLTGEVRGWFTVSRLRNTYTVGQGGISRFYPSNSQYLAEEAIHLADPTINYADLDNEGPDGVPDSGDDDEIIDGIILVHAGKGRDEGGGSGDDFIAVKWNTSGPVPVDGVFGYDFTLNPENGGIGIFLHELGHLLGLPDLYDTELLINSSAGLGRWSLMAGAWLLGGEDSPGDFDAWSKARLGFADEIRLYQDQDRLVIPPVLDSGKVYRLWLNGGGDEEYYLLENRRRTGIDAALPGEGLLIYHVDERVPNNDNSNHYKVALEQADGLYQLENRYGSFTAGDEGDPFRAGDVFSRDTDPSSLDYDGLPSGVSVFNIGEPAADGSVTADVHVVPDASVDVIDVNIEEMEGNGDGLVSAGELAGVRPRFAVYARSAQNLVLSVHSDDRFATVLDTTWNLGTVAAGQVASLPGPIRVRIAPNLPSDPYGMPLRLSLRWDRAPRREAEVELGLGTHVGREDDFDDSVDGWTHGAVRPTALDYWARSPQFGRDGTSGFHCGSYPDGFRRGTDAVLVSPPILLPPDAALLFDQRVDIYVEPGKSSRVAAVIEISVNGGDWQQAVPDGGYPAYFGGSNPEWLARPIFAGKLNDGAFFTTRVDLSQYRGSIRVRFRVFAEDEVLRGNGWFIDNVRVGQGLVPVRPVRVETRVQGADVLLHWILADPVPAQVRWLRGGDPATATAVGPGWMAGAAEGSAIDAGAAELLPAVYWLEGVERDGRIDRWGPWKAEGGTRVTAPFQVLEQPARGRVTFAWGVALPAGAALQIFDVQGRQVAGARLESAPGTWVWGGDGRVAPGIYFARIRGTDLRPLRVVVMP